MAASDEWEALRKLRAEIEKLRRTIEQLEPDDYSLDYDDEEEPEATSPAEWEAFLADHPEIAGAYIGYRPDNVIAASVKWQWPRRLDPILDREYVSWGTPCRSRRDGEDPPLWDDWLSTDHVLRAIRRAFTAHGGPVGTREIGEQLWGPDSDPTRAGRLSAWLCRSPLVTVDRSRKPRRYSVLGDV